MLDTINITSNEANQRLDRFLRKYLKDTSLSEIYKLLRKKLVRVNGQKAAENYRLIAGDVLEIYIDGKERNIESIQEAGRDFSIIYEDDNIIIVDKPPQLIIHTDIKHKNNSLVDQVIYYLYQTGQYDPAVEKTFKPAAVNRLDVNTGGIVLFAKNYESLQNLSIMVRDRLVEKYYMCIVKGVMEREADIKAYLTKDREKNIVKVSYDEGNDSKEIHTRVSIIKTSDKYSLLRINLITGRSHQIRAQLASLNHPIIGDRKYGDPAVNSYFKDKFGLSAQFLYAYKVIFDRAEGNLKYLEGDSFYAKLPSVYNNIVKKLFDYTVEG